MKHPPDLTQKPTATVNGAELKLDEFELDEIAWQLVLAKDAMAGDVIKITYVTK